ncbi:hypothetical protein [Glaciihabitans sp. INWT7]|uniref:hypothetical protein n=1 Tax=Glaciihabitans sp. INWT7 TaxID=2596912 RepID=UPI00162336AB|nr:hypothetical protein [Glaciihabitans sp. INWT7]
MERNESSGRAHLRSGRDFPSNTAPTLARNPAVQQTTTWTSTRFDIVLAPERA